MKWLIDMVKDIAWYFGYRRNHGWKAKDAEVDNIAYPRRRRKHWRDKLWM